MHAGKEAGTTDKGKTNPTVQLVSFGEVPVQVCSQLTEVHCNVAFDTVCHTEVICTQKIMQRRKDLVVLLLLMRSLPRASTFFYHSLNLISYIEYGCGEPLLSEIKFRREKISPR